ncbi:MAG: right-handed parallel beta-helix repeat-containing protein, partial [Planctomycetota bacterium]|nr:right-handed parallel beta-helix repeat-containing protein [Planctomycetota bacterium]
STLWLAGSPLQAVDIQVPLDAPTINAAISLAVDGDEIIVSPGIWNEALDFAGKRIEIRSEAGPEFTTIDGSLDNPVVRFVSGESELAHLNGFTIRGGGGVLVNGVRKGGGIYIIDSSPRISNCIVLENQAAVGAGLAIDGGNVTPIQLDQVEFSQNQAVDSGGGIAITGSNAGVSLVNCLIQNNHADIVGGALYCESSNLQLQSCQIVGNNTDLLAGGIWIYQNSDATFLNCEIAENVTAVTGGGMVVSDFSRVTLDHCLIRDNEGGTSGGGVLMDSGDGSDAQVFRFCVFYGNSASASGANLGVSLNTASILLERCTFGPPAPGVVANITVNNSIPNILTIDSCIIVGGGPQPIQVLPGSTNAFFSCIEGLATSSIFSFDCIDEDPQFVDASSGNLALGPGSACIDGGNPALPVDSDGSSADMGALGPTGAGDFRRGDVDASSSTNLADAIQLLALLFIPGSAPIDCLDAADVDDDGSINITDAIRILDHLFVSGTAFPAPSDVCGVDPTDDTLDCGLICP